MSLFHLQFCFMAKGCASRSELQIVVFNAVLHTVTFEALDLKTSNNSTISIVFKF